MDKFILCLVPSCLRALFWAGMFWVNYSGKRSALVPIITLLCLLPFSHTCTLYFKQGKESNLQINILIHQYYYRVIKLVYVTASYILINACRSMWACFLAACFSSLQVRDKKIDFSTACEQLNRRIIEIHLLKIGEKNHLPFQHFPKGHLWNMQVLLMQI